MKEESKRRVPCVLPYPLPVPKGHRRISEGLAIHAQKGGTLAQASQSQQSPCSKVAPKVVRGEARQEPQKERQHLNRNLCGQVTDLLLGLWDVSVLEPWQSGTFPWPPMGSPRVTSSIPHQLFGVWGESQVNFWVKCREVRILLGNKKN